MKIPDIHCLADGVPWSARGKRGPSFREIYEAIHWQDDFNESQFYYLSRLVERKRKIMMEERSD
ncbi:MAG: hypothetical protein B6I22_13315 [Desulfobacteraceae bacterium 4572_123]|nr:MAG: hypothetical protein B6I22_13315 [Desulfobacteraceae bacterium 4572_123]